MRKYCLTYFVFLLSVIDILLKELMVVCIEVCFSLLGDFFAAYSDLNKVNLEIQKIEFINLANLIEIKILCLNSLG